MASRSMSKTQQRVIKLISQPQSQRSNPEINYVLPWLKQKSDILIKMAESNLKEIVRNCEFLKTEADELIIRQGDQGDCLYILLKGSVSVYINDKMELNEEEEGAKADLHPAHSSRHWVNVATEIVEDLSTKKQDKKFDRKQLGKKIVSFGSGKSFGEIALLMDDNIRTASIIADEECDLMVIRRQLYNATLKAYHEKDFKEKREFINNSPLFMNWSLVHKRQLERGLIKDCYSPDMTVLRQGDDIRGLIFIREGISKVLVEPEKHALQYSHLYPFTTNNNILELEHIKPVKEKATSSGSSSAPPPSSKRSEHVSFENIHVKRKLGYAAAERRMLNKSIVLCTVCNGAMFGDIELMQSLHTYSQSVVSLTYTETYCISHKNVERLITKKHPSTLKTMRDIVAWKMCSRASTVQGRIIPFIRHLVFKMTEERKPEPRPLPDLKHSGKHLPDRDELVQNILHEYLNNRAELIEPYVPGGIYYKAVMRRKAKQRAEERQRLDAIKREKMEREMRNKISAYTTALQNQMEARWNQSLVKRDSDDTKDKIKVESTVFSGLPKVLSQSDPMLSRPNTSSARSKESTSSAKTFMTEVDTKASNRRDKSKGQPSKKVVCNESTLNGDRNHAVCLVYDEETRTSKVKYYGVTEEDCQPRHAIDGRMDESEAESPDSEMYQHVGHCITDGELVGAPGHLISKVTSPRERKVSSKGRSCIDDDHSSMSEDLSLPPIQLRSITENGLNVKGCSNDGNQESDMVLSSLSGEGPLTSSYKQRARTALSRSDSDQVVALPKVTSVGSLNLPDNNYP